MPAFLRGALALLLLSLNTLVHCVALFPVALLKLMLPPARPRLSRWLVSIAESWIAVNSALLDRVTLTRVEVEGLEGLQYEGWYLVLANHQSWVDIPVLQKVFNRRIPFLKFFLKRQLIWVPILGLAWWALDFPFMRRLTKSQLARNPSLRGKDMEITRRACERFRVLPVSVMNFVEGTRFTEAKQARQGKVYRHLLRPKAGGVAFVLGAMGEVLQSVVDVTIAYPDGRPTMWQLATGGVRRVRVKVRQRPIPADLVGDYEGDIELRKRTQAWMSGLWAEKDADLEAMLQR
ncbi:acyltransferase [Alkalisalibacterium limincola]|uniref:Acyltransferase n=1 Tax=Alkalisalibacterium limincola TaxID=2699169 RepID=A0A5C8KNF7_9GAMM|nr:acyltransferase [Alkalisalibacterium limincola]TXK61040.1 acyltransferase [Alkalisalibacterium limincola]